MMFGIYENPEKRPVTFYRLEYSIWTRQHEQDEWTRESGPILGETRHLKAIDARRAMVGLAQKLYRRSVWEYGPTAVDYIHNAPEYNHTVRELVVDRDDRFEQELHRIRVIKDEQTSPNV